MQGLAPARRPGPPARWRQAFPGHQVFQAHNPLMAELRTDGADQLDFYLAARAQIEQIMAPLGLLPAGWECYRPLWYVTFAGQELPHARA
jgi:hypothetical protein